MIWLAHLTTLFAALPAQCNKTFFGIPPWYKYLPMKYDAATKVCSVDNSFQILGNGTNSGIVLIALGIVDILLRLAAMVAVGYVIWGGVKYMTSQGESGELAAAKHTIINALVGLAIALVATTVVVFAGNRLAG
jgi:hypothetical protein